MLVTVVFLQAYLLCFPPGFSVHVKYELHVVISNWVLCVCVCARVHVCACMCAHVQYSVFGIIYITTTTTMFLWTFAYSGTVLLKTAGSYSHNCNGMCEVAPCFCHVRNVGR